MILRKFTVLLLVFILTITTVSSAAEHGRDLHKISYQGIERSYYVHVPEGLPKNAPLVFYLHGYNNRNPKYERFLQVANQEKFVLCVPLAAQDPTGKYGWNVGYAFQKDFKVDDVAFICHLTKKLCKEYDLSKENVFCTGHSNGGEMCYLFAYLKPKFFRALAPLSGLTMEWMYRELTPKQGVPLMEIHGTADKTSYWDGNLSDKRWGPYISVPLAVSNWAIAARCTSEQVTELPLLNKDSRQVKVHIFSSEYNGGIEVQLYEIVGCGHRLSLNDLDYPMVVWNFFKKYLRE
ncbi:MAG: prolyl oligopeptidase family serine peptidase [Alistipes sp.]|nr:prolyl oligopeptidase family serine peptidase [Candidatus Alistipes equi]